MARDVEIESFSFDNWDNINHLPSRRYRVTIILDNAEVLRLSKDSQRAFSTYDEQCNDKNDAHQAYYFSGILIGYHENKNDPNVVDSIRLHILHSNDNITSNIGGCFEETLSILLTKDKNGILQFKDDIGLDGSEPARPFMTIYGEENPLKSKNISFSELSVSEWCYALSRSRRCIPTLDQLLYENEYNTILWEMENIKSHPALTPAKLILVVILFGFGYLASIVVSDELKIYAATFFGLLGGLNLSFLSVRWVFSEIALSRLDRNLQILTLK